MVLEHSVVVLPVKYKMRSGLFFIMNMDIIAMTYDLIIIYYYF